MKRKILTGLLVTLAFAIGISSCTDSNHNESEYSNSNECIITSLSLGALKRVMHTKDSIGNDSTYLVSVTGGLYPLTIDQNNLRIFNLDSLPFGTDTKHTVFTSINSIGGYTIRSLNSGKDTIFTLSDSTDFSVPRMLTIHAMNGTSKREYLVNINVHQEEGDSMKWNQVAKDSTAAFAHFKNTKSFSVDGQLYVFGLLNGISNVTFAKTADYLDNGSLQWTTVPTSKNLQPRSIVRFLNQFYAIDCNQKVISSANGLDWNTTDQDFTANTLVVSGSQRIVALSNGKFYSSTDGTTWNEDPVDEPNMMPEDYATGTRIQSAINKTFETLIIVGQNKDKDVVWKREIDLTGNTAYPWIYLPSSASDKFRLPELEQVTLNTYDEVTLLSGLTQNNEMAPLYLSRDNGRTWKTDGIKTPQAKAHNALTVTVDEDQFIWIFCGTTGEIWRGRINRLGWDEIQGSFEKSRHK